MCTMTGPAAPADTGQALAMVRAGLGYLAACDAGSLATEAQAAALTGLEAAEAQHTAARAKILSAFTGQHGYEADGQYGAAAWLRATTRITRAAAAAATGWARRLAAHPVIAAALAAGQVPASLARLICDATDQLPEQHRGDADGILLAAVLGGADQHDLARLAREMLERAHTGPGTGEDGFEERAVWLGTTFGGAGRWRGPDPRLRRRADGGAGRAGAEGRAGRYPHRGPAPPRRDRGGLRAADIGAADPRPGRPARAPDRARGPERPARRLGGRTVLDPGDGRGRPGGLASCLRGTLLAAPFSTPSQPLDVGRTTRTIPPHLAPPSPSETSTANSRAAGSPHPSAKPTT